MKESNRQETQTVLTNVTQNDYFERLSLLLSKMKKTQNHLSTSGERSFVDYDTYFANLSMDDWSVIENDFSSLISDISYSNQSDQSNTYGLMDVPSETFNLFELIINGYLTVAIASIGIFTNVLAICYISVGNRKGKFFYLLLTALFVADLLFLSLEIMRCIELFFIPIPKGYLWIYHTIVHSGRYQMLHVLINPLSNRYSACQICSHFKAFSKSNKRNFIQWNEGKVYEILHSSHCSLCRDSFDSVFWNRQGPFADNVCK